MSDLFGTMTVHVVTIEWGDLDDIDVRVATSLEDAQSVARGRVIETMKATVEEYNPDGCRDFVLSDSALDDEHWLEELHELATVPWVTITEHTVPIQ